MNLTQSDVLGGGGGSHMQSNIPRPEPNWSTQCPAEGALPMDTPQEGASAELFNALLPNCAGLTYLPPAPVSSEQECSLDTPFGAHLIRCLNPVPN